ncbi:putative dioxygenase subunit alpha YeaW [Penicillium rolfsii]|nr:putative dioxygenase subunit alpha YeaW [Penicillium rolfsii]
MAAAMASLFGYRSNNVVEKKLPKEPPKALPASWYCSPDLYELERRAIFSKKWILVTHKLRFTKPGDYLRFHEAGFSFFLCLDREGSLNGFHNICRHRAFPLVSQDEGNVKILSCKYHGWSYGLNGKLAKAPRFDNVPGFSKEDQKLFPVHVHVDALGFIWVNLDSSPNPVPWEEDFKAVDTQERFQNFDFSQYKFDHTWQMDGDYNWKTLADNYNECYHCTVAHPDVANIADLSYYYTISTPGHIQHFSRPKEDKVDEDIKNASTYYFPNACMTVSPHFFYMMRCVPTSVSTCSMEYEVYRHKEASDADFEYIDAFFKRVLAEDKYLCNEAQKNLNAGVFVNGQLHPELESAPIFFQNTVRSLLLEHRREEQKEQREIWPARQVSAGSSTAEDIDFCSGLACSAESNGKLDCRGYDSWEGSAAGDGVLADRLQQLEEKMNLLLEQSTSHSHIAAGSLGSYASGDAASKTTSDSHGSPTQTFRSHDELNLQDANPTTNPTISRMPPREMISKCIALYFQYCHKQPLWLFDPEDFSNLAGTPDEIILGISSLALRYSRSHILDGQVDRQCRQYAEAAQSLISIRIARGKVNLSTMQALCLIALAEYIANDTHLAWLHIGLVKSLATCGNIDIELHEGQSTPTLEARRRLFWSINFLSQQFGPRSLSLNILRDIQNPKYTAVNIDTPREMGVIPPQVPQETGSLSSRGGIWVYMVQLGSLWREVQNYVSHCASGYFTPPWSVESSYSIIGAHLMNLETNFPMSHRYDSARFQEQSVEELHGDRSYWSPWLYLQFTYHAVHSVINHPFLYSWRPQQSAQLAVPNTFWKTSSELALIHTTWTVRLIDMVTEKDYQLSDPSIGHLVAIATTIHLYYCRAADPALRESAQRKVETCTNFLSDLAAKWPTCDVIYQKVQALIQMAFAVSPNSSNNESPRRTISIDTELMWDILLQNPPQNASSSSARGLFEPSFFEPLGDTSSQKVTVETEIFHHSTRTVDTSDGGQALPPYSSTVRDRPPSNGSMHEIWRERSSFSEGHGPVQGPLPRETLGWSVPGLQNDVSFMDITRDPFYQFQDQDHPYMGVWEFGNL